MFQTLLSWVAIYCKEHDMSVKGAKKHADEMKGVVACLQEEHGLGAKGKSAWKIYDHVDSRNEIISCHVVILFHMLRNILLCFVRIVYMLCKYTIQLYVV